MGLLFVSDAVELDPFCGSLSSLKAGGGFSGPELVFKPIELQRFSSLFSHTANLLSSTSAHISASTDARPIPPLPYFAPPPSVQLLCIDEIFCFLL
jgi:hypothetical protein